ncbi:MAG: phosphoglucomutase, alpha-D-glucose phosphate-specific, partial [Candidatus Dormibacteraeota bacterium]|nr:phosphoglucomutase, alpha-D-glucose phosphate-specific [Candidatus Dormibacteraeota bacterium]
MPHPAAGKPAQAEMLANVPRLVTAYFVERPDPADPGQRVSFGTSGHRGSASEGTFNEAHILATTQAVCEYRAAQGVEGPLFLGLDTHALSEPALASTLEVLAANRVEVMVDSQSGYTPTPAVSHAILVHNRGRRGGLADGVVLTPSHNPPDQGGFKYNPPAGGPAGTEATGWIQERANAILAGDLKEVRRVPYRRAREAPSVHR